MDMQDVSNLVIPEGAVRTIHGSDRKMLWGKVAYDTEYKGDSNQNGTPTPENPVQINVATGAQIFTINSKNLIDLVPATNTSPSKTQSISISTTYDSTLGRDVVLTSGTSTYPYFGFTFPKRLQSGKYYAFQITYRSEITTSGTVTDDDKNFRFYPGKNNKYTESATVATGMIKDESGNNQYRLYYSESWITRCIRFYADPTVYATESDPAYYTGFSISYVPRGISGNVTSKKLLVADIQVYEITQAEWDATNYNPTSYDAYQVKTCEVDVSSRNLLTNFGPSGTSGGITHSWNNAEVTLSGLSTSTWSNISNQLNVIVPAGTYTFSITPSSSLFRTKIRISYGGTNHDQPIQKGSSSYTFTLPEESKLGLLFIDNFSNNTDISGSYKIQLEKGDSPTQYMPYYNNELSRVNTAVDKIYKNGDNWWIRKETGKIASYNGESVITDYISTTGQLTTGATIYYALSTPTDTQITDSPLIAQLDAVHEWLTRYGYNATVTGNLPIIIDRANL